MPDTQPESSTTILEGELVLGTESISDTPESTPTLTEEKQEETKTLYLDLQPLHSLANNEKIVVPRDPNFSRKDVVNAFQSAFDLIGGVPRLALWADVNQTDFYKMYSKLIPTGASSALGEVQDLRIAMHIVPGPLDKE